MRHLLDLDRYPLDRLDSVEGAALIDRCRTALARDGLFNLDSLIRPEALEQCVAELAPLLAADAYTHRQTHNIYFSDKVDGVDPDHPALARHVTANRKICADQMPGAGVMQLYEWPPLAAFLARVMDKPRLYAMADPLARVNVMTYRDGEALNWHFDRSEFTTTLLLQAPAEGGEFQYRPDLRSPDEPNFDGVARLLKGADDQVRTLELAAGTLNVFKGVDTAHRVTPVVGDRERMIAVYSYYEEADVRFSERDQLRFYGRTA